MSKSLVVIESGGKIDELKKFLGKKYDVVSCGGHLWDLDTKGTSVDVENDFEPTYAKNPLKLKEIKKVKSAASNTDEVIIATDMDREGEMIGWGICQLLKIKDPKRFRFGSITKKEIEREIKKPGKLNYNLIDSQKARRILDRLIGYEISPILMSNVNRSAKSAGRVQSVVAKLVIEKEREISSFFEQDEESFFRFSGIFFDQSNEEFRANLFKTVEDNDEEKEEEDEESDGDNKNKKGKKKKAGAKKVERKKAPKDKSAKIKGEKAARKLLKIMAESEYSISDISNRDSCRNPAPPYETSTLQQDAYSKLGLPPKRTMSLAQKLYENGHITYMRTDSISLSDEALEKTKEYVLEKYGKKYYKLRKYETKDDTAQEAHEAIRPTHIENDEISTNAVLDEDSVRLYDLIWRRTVASQMMSAIFDIKTIKIAISETDDYYFVTDISKIKFDGFLVVYNIKNTVNDDGEIDNEDDDNDLDLPDIDEIIEIKSVMGIQDYNKPPIRYSETSLGSKIKKLKIGRPSTYVASIEKIIDREYVKKENIEGVKKKSLTLIWKKDSDEIEEKNKNMVLGKENNKLVPTPLGYKVIDFLNKKFPNIMDYKFTANLEKELSDVANGEKNWVDVVRSCYDDYHPIIEKLKKEKPIDESARFIGKHPDTDASIYATDAKYGPVVKMEIKKNKFKYASIDEPLTIETITFDEALLLLQYPKMIGKLEDKDVELCKGKMGFYVKWNDYNYSLKDKNVDPEEITLDEIKEIINEKRSNILWSSMDGKLEYSVRKGKEGKNDYICVRDTGKKMSKPTFVSFPKDTEIEDLTIEKIKEIIESKPKTSFSNFRGRGRGRGGFVRGRGRGRGRGKGKKNDDE